MIANEPLGNEPLATSSNSTGEPPTPPFDWWPTVISQFANSPILLKLIGSFAAWLDPSTDFDRFFGLMFDINRAQGYGLDVWGRIVDVSRVLRLPATGTFFGFDESPDAHSFGESPFFGGGSLTQNFSLSDTAYRRLIFAKALANICDGSIPAINQILINLFSDYGNCYVTDGGDMTMTYTFGSTLSTVDFAIVSQSGVLPRPAGVSVSVVQL